MSRRANAKQLPLQYVHSDSVFKTSRSCEKRSLFHFTDTQRKRLSVLFSNLCACHSTPLLFQRALGRPTCSVRVECSAARGSRPLGSRHVSRCAFTPRALTLRVICARTGVHSDKTTPLLGSRSRAFITARLVSHCRMRLLC